MAWPFLEPVNADEVPDYYDVITDPIGRLVSCYTMENWSSTVESLEGDRPVDGEVALHF